MRVSMASLGITLRANVHDVFFIDSMALRRTHLVYGLYFYEEEKKVRGAIYK